MRAAFGTGHFGAYHAVGLVAVLGDVCLVNRDIKAGPAGSGLEFCFAIKQSFPATSAFIGALVMTIPVFARKSALGAFAAANVVLLGSKLVFVGPGRCFGCFRLS